MAAKLDKETMKKQHFWLLLIPLFIGLLLAWLGLFFGVAEATADKEAENKKTKEGIDKAQAQAKKKLELYDKRKDELFDLRTRRWEEMYKIQQEMFQWPAPLDDTNIAKVKDLKFGAEISDNQFLNAFRDQAMKGYDDVEKDVAPIKFAGDWRAVLRNVPGWRKNPTSEDVWLAIEDYWVQRELLTTLAGVNSELAKFQKPSELSQNHPLRATLKDTPRERTFIGRTWRVDLKIENRPDGPFLTGTLTNLTSRLQPFNATSELVLNVWLTNDPDAKPFRFAIEGTHLEGGKTEPIKEVKSKHLILEGQVNELARVEQVFDARTAPVKRLDKMSLGFVSSKHAQAELQMPDFSTKAVEAATPAGGTGVSGPPGPPGYGAPMGPPGGVGPPGATAMGGAATNTDYTDNGLARRRYVNLTGQVRAMPIGLVVVIDQAFVQDVLTAITNSKLRFQTVQSHMARFHGSLSYASASPAGGGLFGLGAVPSVTEGAAGIGAAGPPGPPRPGGRPPGPPAPTPGAPPGGGFVPGAPPGGGPTFGGFGGYGYGSSPQSSSDDQAAGNLVEVAIYGLASLYEKFEGPAKKDDGTGAAATTGTATDTTSTGKDKEPGKGPDAKGPEAKTSDAKGDATPMTPPAPGTTDPKAPATPAAPGTTPPAPGTPPKM
jgi:hypothetical protein